MYVYACLYVFYIPYGFKNEFNEFNGCVYACMCLCASESRFGTEEDCMVVVVDTVDTLYRVYSTNLQAKNYKPISL